MEIVVLLYTPNPYGSSDPSSDQISEGKVEDFNISWLRGGHPILNVGDLSIEATQSLGLLLDQLRFPTVKSHSNLMIILLINSLSAIASKRPAFYGRILPVLLGLEPSSSRGKGVHHALKTAFLSCLNCAHPGAAPWRDRLIGALKDLEGGAKNVVSPAAFQSNGSLEEENDIMISQDVKPTAMELDLVRNNTSRKRLGVQDNSEILDDEMSGKRAKSTPPVTKEVKKELAGNETRVPPSELGASKVKVEKDNGPVQQLVSMFGALVAQGEKAVASLEILISSISADLLAEVVIANMQNLPSVCPPAEADEASSSDKESHTRLIGSNSELANLGSLLASILSQSSASPVKDTPMDSLPSAQNVSEPLESLNVHGFTDASEDAPLTPTVSSHEHVKMENIVSGTASDVIDVGNLKSGIPGLDVPVHHDTMIITSMGSAELQDASQDQVSSLARSSLDVFPSASTDKSEELSPGATVADTCGIISSTATSAGFPKQLPLPKISAPVLTLTNEQSDILQKAAFVRITDAYRQIAIAGASQACLSVLAFLGVKFPLDLDSWKILQTHILSDYENHEGHELTLRVLYRLYGEAEQDHDFVSSTTATSVYETFLLAVVFKYNMFSIYIVYYSEWLDFMLSFPSQSLQAETLRSSFPASDKSLNKLLCEVPYLPKSIFVLLEEMCCTGSGNKDDKLNAERVRQGLGIIWSLISSRPPFRDACLEIALKSATHLFEEVRDKALRLVVNRLYPLPSISQQIENFAREMLVSAAKSIPLVEKNEFSDGASAVPQEEPIMEKSSSELPSINASSKEQSADNYQLLVPQSTPASLLAEGQRRMDLYFALCTKNHSLFRQVFVIYETIPEALKQAVIHRIPKLVPAIGQSSELLSIISDPPAGSEELVVQVLRTLIGITTPSPELLSIARRLYDTQVKDVEILILILPFLPKDQVLAIFPHLVSAPSEKFHVALSRILQGSIGSSESLTPAEVLIAIHGIDPERDGIPLKKVTDACNACFEQQQIFTHQVLAKVLNQLVEQIPIPLLFMRTVLQAIGAFPSLVDFVMEILSRLVNKQIWRYPKQWVGFVRCALLTKPKSFGVLLQLPPAQLENALNRTPALREPLIAHASQSHIKSSLPRSVLAVLGLASDAQSSALPKPTNPQPGEKSELEPSQSSHVQSGDTSKSDKEVVDEKSKESSDAS
ncbi:OLC1v1033622C5 [Oldenlandia corymbosa var. corymbosa]|uniref:OLC1v1033622C5 n=1 Tax=Oldenlandia corymbosa var. corymbosa TaxID=529605 RepID=A0AAV1CRL0_OLDCO|nr:OLC1v1033622C5 [Oldenlandia corymbosa var. corymbosa]